MFPKALPNLPSYLFQFAGPHVVTFLDFSRPWSSLPQALFRQLLTRTTSNQGACNHSRSLTLGVRVVEVVWRRRGAGNVQVLFLDDSATKDSWHAGYGGFCLDADALPALTRDLQELKKSFGLPSGGEIKWSPDKSHYLRIKFTGVRHELYKAVIDLLGPRDARVICAVHALKECYGVALHGWSRNKATRWAIRQQLRFIAERYERPYLTSLSQDGLIICDEYDSKTEQDMSAQQFAFDMVFGTKYEIFEHIPHLPLIALSQFSAPLQIADVVVGVVTSAVGGGRYGIALFDSVARHFLWNPHAGSSGFSSMVSAAILGFGLKVFPASQDGRARNLFKGLDAKFLISDQGWRERRTWS